MMTNIYCTNCRQPYPKNEVPFRCQKCGGIFDFSEPLSYNPAEIISQAPGLWRYRHTFGLPPESPEVTLGEGDTPLVWCEVFSRKVAFKLEYLNPTGSFKDRGTALLVSFLLSRGVQSAVEDSSGNAGSSFAAYAARAGLKARVFVPAYASGPKRAQIETYGAELIPIEGPRSEATEAVLKAASQGEVYASHAYMPFGLPGISTVAYEIFEQLGQVPGALITPAGQGSLLLGAGRGFEALREAGLSDRMPLLIGVQTLACAPMWSVFKYGPSGLGWVTEGETLAEGVRIKHPLRGDVILQMIMRENGQFVVVEEEQILPGRDQLAKIGLYVEPTSAIVWSALQQLVDQLPDPIVVVLTGSGFKSN
jgi:threonine synthase